MSEIVPDGTNFVPHAIWWIYVTDKSCGTFHSISLYSIDAYDYKFSDFIA